MDIGIVGTGTIATAVVRGIAVDGHQITVSSRNAANAAALAQAFPNVTVADNQAVLNRSAVIMLGLMASDAPEILKALNFAPHHRVISLMADVSLDDLAAIVAPARAEAIMLPFPAIARGGSAIIAQGKTGLVRTLFSARNQVFEVANADDLQAYVCAQAVLSPVARMVDDAARWLGRRVAAPDQGEAFLRKLVASSLDGDESCETLIQALNTPGGYNQRLRLHLEQAGLGAALSEGLDRLKD